MRCGIASLHINQALAPTPKHEIMGVRWSSKISCQRIKDQMWWCKHFKFVLKVELNYYKEI
jgi:hypothetical protein